MDVLAQVIVGMLAFAGAYLGTKRIKKHLIDGYIEERVKKALTANDKVLSKVRSLLSSIEQEYSINRPITDDEIGELLEECKYLSRISEDAGKEVATIGFLLYQVIKDLKPFYKTETKSEERSSESLSVGQVVGLIDYTLRVIADYCVNTTPIPFSARLVKRSSIRLGLRKYLVDSKYYRMKHQPFGLTLRANSEVVVRFSSIVGKFNSAVFRIKLFVFLQDNYPMLYELLASKLYVPLVLEGDGSQGISFLSTKLHLVKIEKIRTGEDGRDYLDCSYANIDPWINFVDGHSLACLKENYRFDAFLGGTIDIDSIERIERRVLETVKFRIPLDVAREAFQNQKWKIRRLMLKTRFSLR